LVLSGFLLLWTATKLTTVVLIRQKSRFETRALLLIEIALEIKVRSLLLDVEVIAGCCLKAVEV
jgi:hypothetical protein